VRREHESAFRAAAAAHQHRLRRLAFSLSSDWHAGDDLAQTSLLKLAVAWPLRDEGAVAAWLTSTLVRSWIDETRRPWWRRERLTDTVPDSAAPPEPSAAVAADLVRALDHLPPRQRACLVLRFLDDCSVEQTADVLRCSVGSVKTHTSRGLAAVRQRMGVDLTPSGLPGRTTSE